MYRGFVGTFISHFLSLLCTLWAIFEVHSCMFEPLLLNYARVGLILVAINSSLGLVRYGSSDGYKLRTWHIITLNVSAITNFSITEAVVLHMRNAPLALLSFPALNVIPLFSNILAKEYRTKLRFSDVFIGVNCLILLLSSFLNENYYGMALSLSNFFGYFIIGDSGYFLDTEVPSIDAFQYLTCFLNFFNVIYKWMIFLKRPHFQEILLVFLNASVFLFAIVSTTFCSECLKMSSFVPGKEYLRGILLHYFIQKKSAAEAHRILVETYGEHALSETTCRDWFRRFKNGDFDLQDKERSGAPKKFKDEELEALLDVDASQTLTELGKSLGVDDSTVSKRLKALGMIQKEGHWIVKH